MVFILQVIIMLSLGALLYLFGRALPRISEEDIRPQTALAPHRFMNFVEKADEWFKSVFENFLRRLRVIILKLDNMITKKINSFKKEPTKEVGFLMEQTKSDDLNNSPLNSRL